MRIIGMGFAMLALLLAAVGGVVMSQNSCASPFAGVLLRFETDFWTKTDFCQRSVDISEIRSGGPPPDGIPPIDNPVFELIDLASLWLQEQSPVIALEINGDARAYPLAILTWHEIANDVVGGVPVAVTFCPLCNSAIVFDRRVGDETLRFGVSGLLRNSDMVMWDDRTQSFWQQFTGEGIVGAYTGVELEIIPSLVIGFGTFADEYPDGTVLSRDTGRTRSYGANPYVGYDSSPQPFLFEGSIDPRLPATEHVLGGLVAGTAVAYPFPLLRERIIINDVIEAVPVVAFFQSGVASALDQRTIDASRDIGTAALYERRLNDRELTFTLRDGAIYDDQTSSRWNAFGRAIEGELAGAQLRRLRAGVYFWFAWAAFRPDTILRTE
jgi:hypothetical protein